MICANSNTVHEKSDNWVIGNSNSSWGKDFGGYHEKNKDTKRNIKEDACVKADERNICDNYISIPHGNTRKNNNRELEKEIEHSKYILSFENDWDEEGAGKYKRETWNRGIKYLEGHARWLKENRNIIIDVPKVSHGPNGSIDILWETEAYKLLLNIPEAISKKATFYGEDNQGFILEGELNTDLYNEGLTLWLENKEMM